MRLNNFLKYSVIFFLIFSVSSLLTSFDNGEKSVSEIAKTKLHNQQISKNIQTKGKIIKTRLDDDPTVYWFFAAVKFARRSNGYKLTGTPGGVSYGKTIDFEKDLWANLSRRRIAVGPFLSKNEALNARRLYKSKRDRIRGLPRGQIPNEVHWFAVAFGQSDRLRIFVFERAPGAVVSGTENFFIDVFYEQLQRKLLSIGPFYDYEQAEIAKRLYRKNE